MAEADPCLALEAAFETIEETILPSLSMVLDSLIESASLARPGADADSYAAELRTLAVQLEEVTRQVESVSPARIDPQAYCAAGTA